MVRNSDGGDVSGGAGNNREAFDTASDGFENIDPGHLDLITSDRRAHTLSLQQGAVDKVAPHVQSALATKHARWYAVSCAF